VLSRVRTHGPGAPISCAWVRLELSWLGWGRALPGLRVESGENQIRGREAALKATAGLSTSRGARAPCFAQDDSTSGDTCFPTRFAVGGVWAWSPRSPKARDRGHPTTAGSSTHFAALKDDNALLKFVLSQVSEARPGATSLVLRVGSVVAGISWRVSLVSLCSSRCGSGC